MYLLPLEEVIITRSSKIGVKSTATDCNPTITFKEPLSLDSLVQPQAKKSLTNLILNETSTHILTLIMFHYSANFHV